jgi:hypothetical protein
MHYAVLLSTDKCLSILPQIGCVGLHTAALGAVKSHYTQLRDRVFQVGDNALYAMRALRRAAVSFPKTVAAVKTKMDEVHALRLTACHLHPGS